ncbi:MAG TPA: tetratricopeptide repeat protein [Thermoanaerobaculia bacterium]|nr:tetratricopeptide repeat protein [Thermoanaerobaculia bacterium]
MPERDPAVAPPFDQGVFLLHYNRGREAFQEGRYAEARRELEAAQRLRPDDADVLNLLGLVYFKTNAFPEAEVIYRRLIAENANVFILHSNLGLILFKQGKHDEAEHFLLRAVELRPNYAKSHLYLGLLYRHKKKYAVSLEHLRFAGADKLVREVEQEMRPVAPVAPPPAPTPPPAPVAPPPAAPARPADSRVSTAKIPALTPQRMEQIQREAQESRTQPGTTPMPSLPPNVTQPLKAVTPVPVPPMAPAPAPVAPPPPPVVAVPIPTAATTAARKLQDAVDEPQHVEAKVIDVARKIEGASKTFTLHENGFLEINFARSVHCKRGTVSSYSGNLKFVAESGLLGTTAQTLVKAVGQGKIFVYEKGRKTFLLDLNDEFIYVEGSNLLALEDSLTYRVEPIYDGTYQKKIDTVKIFGKGSLAISTSIEPLTLRVTREYPLSISSNALVAWTGNIIPTVMVDDKSLENVMIENEGVAGFKIRFEGDGVVVSEQ